MISQLVVLLGGISVLVLLVENPRIVTNFAALVSSTYTNLLKVAFPSGTASSGGGSGGFTQ